MDYFLDSFRAALELLFRFDPNVYRIVWTSLKISLSASALATLCWGYGSRCIAFRAGKRLLPQTLHTLMAMPTVMMGLIFYGLLRRGPLGYLGHLYTRGAVILGEFVLILPIVVKLVIAGVQCADPRLLPTLRSISASAWQQLALVVCETQFAIFVACVMGFGRAIGEVGTAMMPTSNIQGSTRTMTTAIALETSKGEFELGFALGSVLLSIAFAVTAPLHGLPRRTA